MLPGTDDSRNGGRVQCPDRSADTGRQPDSLVRRTPTHMHPRRHPLQPSAVWSTLEPTIVDRATVGLGVLGVASLPVVARFHGGLHTGALALAAAGLAGLAVACRAMPVGRVRSSALGVAAHLIAWAVSIQIGGQTEWAVFSSLLLTMQVAYANVSVLVPGLILMLAEHVVVFGAVALGLQLSWLPARADSTAMLVVAFSLKCAHAMMSVLVSRALEQRSREAELATRQLIARADAADARTDALLAADAILAGLVDSSEDAIAVMDITGRIVVWNPAQECVTGIPASAAHGAHHDGVMATASRERAAALAEALRGNSTRLTGVAMRRATNGAPGIADLTYVPLRTEDGTIAGAFCVAHDVTDREHAVSELTMARRQLADAIEAVDSGFALYDEHDRIISVNTAFRSLYPAVAHYLTPGTDYEMVLRAYLRSRPDLLIDGDMETTVAQRLAERRTPASRSEVLQGETWVQVEDRVTRGGGRVSLRTDITHLKRIQDDLERARERAEAANRAKSDFLARMSHELRTPLNSIIGFSRVVGANRHGGLTERDCAYLKRVATNGEHLLALINDILDLARVEAGKMPVILGDVDCTALAIETAHMLESQAQPGVQLIAAVPRVPVMLHSDQAKLHQILINLVGNALKFTRAGSVSILVAPPDADGTVELSVSDTGIGIPPDRLASIFESFEQADGTTSREFGGTGLGLAITRSLCALIDATVSVESTVGVGTTFRVRCHTLAPVAAA
jgi:PAS domain S-box-containing protein